MSFRVQKKLYANECISQGRGPFNSHHYFKGRLKKQPCVTIAKATEACVAWNLTTMDMRVFLEQSVHSEDSSYTILVLKTPYQDILVAW